MPHNKVKLIQLDKFSEQNFVRKDDYLAVESPLEIRVGHDAVKFYTLAVTLCTPAEIEHLVYGYLFTETIISQANDILSVQVFDNEFGLVVEILLIKEVEFSSYLNKRSHTVHTSCGLCGKTSFDDLLTCNYPTIDKANSSVPNSVILSLPQKLNQQQKSFAQTGGLHASALYSLQGELLILKEDIGRHNALDKLIGVALEQDLLPLTDYIILLSGRVSFELVHKSLLAGLSTLVSIGAPSSLSVEVAKFNNLTLLGFIKPDQFNVYHNQNLAISKPP